MAECGDAVHPRAFYFVRHGEADWNVTRHCIGQLDRPLTERGHAQARKAQIGCAGLAISAVYFSPLVRAAQTAAQIVGTRDIPLIAEPGLLEACLGVKQGAREDDKADPFLRQWIGGSLIEGAETYLDFRARVGAAVNRCLGEQPTPGLPMIVAHAGVYHALRDLMKMPVGPVRHCVPYQHTPDAASWRVDVLSF